MFELEASQPSTTNELKSSKFDSLFTTEELVVIENFRSWLVEVHNFQKTSASSYVTNFKRARSKSLNEVEVNSDERSARAKFALYMKSL